MKVALITFAAGQSSSKWQDFVRSAQLHFLPNTQRQHFFFSDSDAPPKLPECVTWVPVPNGDDLDLAQNRCNLVLQSQSKLNQFDFVLAFAEISEFHRTVSEDFLHLKSNQVLAVQHPQYVNIPSNRLPFERNAKSRAHVAVGQGQYYVTDRLIGGSPQAYLAMHRVISSHIDEDYREGMVAERGFESYLNRFIIDHPHVIRHPGHCYPAGWDLGVPKVIVVADWKSLKLSRPSRPLARAA